MIVPLRFQIVELVSTVKFPDEMADKQKAFPPEHLRQDGF